MSSVKSNVFRIRIPVPEAFASRINPGDAVSLSFPSFADEKSLPLVVTRRAGRLNEETRTMVVEADAENVDGKLLPGMFGQATITLTNKANADVLPARAVRFREDGTSYVYVIDDNDTVKISDVAIGKDDGTVIEIVGGISSDARVIDSHLKRFSDGERVSVLQ